MQKHEYLFDTYINNCIVKSYGAEEWGLHKGHDIQKML